MARAVLEGVGFNLKTILDILEKDSPAGDVIMIGAGVKGDIWLRILSDIWQKPLLLPEYLEEATSLGAAICGGVGIGVFKDFSVAEKFNKSVRRIEPDKDTAELYGRLYDIFRETYEQLSPIYQSLASFSECLS
jgi:xylulokinase